MEKVDKEVVVLLMAHVPRFETDSLKVQQAMGWQPRRNTETFLREIDNRYCDNEAQLHTI